MCEGTHFWHPASPTVLMTDDSNFNIFKYSHGRKVDEDLLHLTDSFYFDRLI